MSEVLEVKELATEGKIQVAEGVVKFNYGATYDKNKDGQVSAGAGGYIFIAIPELMEELAKDNATMLFLAKWIEANKNLIPKLEKEI